MFDHIEQRWNRSRNWTFLAPFFTISYFVLWYWYELPGTHAMKQHMRFKPFLYGIFRLLPKSRKIFDLCFYKRFTTVHFSFHNQFLLKTKSSESSMHRWNEWALVFLALSVYSAKHIYHCICMYARGWWQVPKSPKKPK